MLNYLDIIKQKREERQKYVNQLNAMKDEHNVEELMSRYSLELYDYNSLLEKMKLFSELDNPEYPPFFSKEDYIATRTRLSNFAERRKELLDVSAILYTYEENLRRCNSLFEKSILDDSAYIAGQNDIIYTNAKQFLKNAHNFNKYLTPEFLFAISASAVKSLPKADVLSLAEEGFILVEDVEKMIDIPNSESTLEVLRDNLGVIPPVTEKHPVKLKGVSYENEDGSSRQEYLKELSNAKDKSIKIETYSFHNQKENRIEPAANVLWNGKCIGCLPASLMIDLNERFSNLKLSAEIESVVGGGDFNYGCHIVLTVIGNNRNKTPKIDLEQFLPNKQSEKLSDTIEHQESNSNDEQLEMIFQ